ncbi:MAG: CHAD domain-containing protein [Gammaproteobacteria bacterium]|nr:CHAD domain-containing protein [Gammaproteobacteria bacterium]
MLQMKNALFQRTSSSRGAFARFRDRAAQNFAIRRCPSRSIIRSFYDTADWRLFRRGQTLEHDQGRTASTRLRGIGDSSTFIEEPLQSVPRFGREFPESALGGAVAPVIGVRALLPLGEFRVRVSPYEVADRRGKILAYIERERVQAPYDQSPEHAVSESIRIKTLRGYEKAGRLLAAELDRSLSSAPAAGDPWYRLLALSGKTPGDYSTRLRVCLVPEMNSRQALAQVLLILLEGMQKSMAGIRVDLDPEFLHDFRVAGRRSRTLLTQVRGVFAEAEIAPFKDAFAWLSSETGARRDLDVFLWDFPRYREMLGQAPQTALEPLHAMLSIQRNQAHAALLCTLDSDRLARFTRQWGEFLEAVSRTGAVPGDAAPVLRCSNRAIRRLIRALLRRGGAVEPGYSEELHDLRKTGKKLRYVMEAFGSLYPEDVIEPALKNLRQLQNVLGGIVDYHVQQDIVRNWRGELAKSLNADSPTLVALDRLATEFEALEVHAGDDYQACYERFAAIAGARRRGSLLGGRR